MYNRWSCIFVRSQWWFQLFGLRRLVLSCLWSDPMYQYIARWCGPSRCMSIRVWWSGAQQAVPPTPYSLPCVRELLRFLVSLINPYDQHNTDVMIHMGLSLLTIAFESGVDHIARFQSLLALVKDEMAKNLIFVSICTVCRQNLWSLLVFLGYKFSAQFVMV